MKIFSIDTAEKSCSLALVENGVPICEALHASPVTHSRLLMAMVDQMLGGRVGISVNDIDGFVAAIGPGSFTGLRIGISVVKGLAFAVSKPLAGISSLDGIAWQHSFSALPVCIMMDAKRGEVYCAVYQFKGGVLIKKSKEVVARPGVAIRMAGEKALFAGSGVVAYQSDILKALGKNAWFVPGFQNSVKAAALAHVLFQRPGLLSDDPASVLPVYLRRSDAELNFKNP